jgi:hypothetical protein
MEYKVGQTLWFQRTLNVRDSGSGEYVVVTKVGRKWVDLAKAAWPAQSYYKVVQGTTQVDGGAYSSPGRLWETKEACNAYVQVAAEWQALTVALSGTYAPPQGVTLEALTQARALLGLPKKD